MLSQQLVHELKKVVRCNIIVRLTYEATGNVYTLVPLIKNAPQVLKDHQEFFKTFLIDFTNTILLDPVLATKTCHIPK